MTDRINEKDDNKDNCHNESEEDQIVGTYQRAQLKDMGSTTTRSDKGVIHCLTIVGQDRGPSGFAAGYEKHKV